MVTPASFEELRSWIAEGFVIHQDFPNMFQPEANLSLAGLAGIVEFSPLDQVITVKAGTRVEDINSEIATSGLGLPVASFAVGDPWFGLAPLLSPDKLTVGDAVAFNPYHALEPWVGGWNDWVLEVKLVDAKATLIRTGSRVVKNVAGYDLHKFMCGSRNRFGIPYEFTLRVFPLAALPKLNLEGDPTSTLDPLRKPGTRLVLPTKFAEEEKVLGSKVLATIPEYGVIFGYDLMQPINTLTETLTHRAAQLFDPESRMNPNVFRGGLI